MSADLWSYSAAFSCPSCCCWDRRPWRRLEHDKQAAATPVFVWRACKRSLPPTLFGLIACGSRSLWFRTSACSSLEGCQFSHSCQMSWQCSTWNTRLSTLKGFVYKRRKYTYVFGRSMCRVLVIVLVWILFFFSPKSKVPRGTLFLRLIIICQIAILQLSYILGCEIWSPFWHFSFSKSWLFNVRGSCSLLPPLFV